ETKPFIQMETFERHLDILDKLNVGQIRLIGGEPTLHPHFPMLVETALQRGKPILIFSNGLMPPKVVATLEKTDPQTCTVLVNMSAANGVQRLNQEQQERRSWVLQQLGPRVLLGFNITDPIFALDDLFDVIRNSDCQRSIRIGLAQPVLNGKNRYLRPKYYPKVGRSIVDSAIQAYELGIVLEFDCGFVRCMFSDEEVEILEKTGADYGWRCNPVLDIDISGVVFHCYPLAEQFSINLSKVSDPRKLRDRFEWGFWMQASSQS
ncbi:MAG: radical SAM protein, partial [Desulfosarcinaceae bacterium]